MPSIKESDWKILRDLKPQMLELFCARVLTESGQICVDAMQSNHERYLKLFTFIRESDRKLATGFDTPSRARRCRRVQKPLNLVYSVATLPHSEAHPPRP